MTDLGREIPITDGRKPEWLADDDRVLAKWGGVWASINMPAHMWDWPNVTAIRLRADHPFYRQEPSFDTDKYVLVERMTEAEWFAILAAKHPMSQISILLRRSGIIKPDPTPLERYMEQYPGDDRDMVARVMAWKESA